jgi:hypothetical protein
MLKKKKEKWQYIRTVALSKRKDITMSMSIHDVEKIQALYPEHQIELREGKIIIQAPCIFTTIG